MAAAAGATTKLDLMTAITLVPLYPPALLAKMTAALAVASGERLHLGVGVGGENPAEFEACGVPVAERGVRTDESLEVLRLLLGDDNVTFDGRFSSFSDVTIAPRPSKRPPIWISGRSGAAMRRAARFGDGWLPYMYTPDMYADSLERITSQRESDGPVMCGLFAWACVHEDGAVARAWVGEALSRTYAQDFTTLVDRYAIAGTPEEVVARIGEFCDVGVERLLCSFGCPPTEMAATRRLFTDEVLPALRDESASPGATTPS